MYVSNQKRGQGNQRCEGSRLTVVWTLTTRVFFFLQDPGETSTSGVTDPNG